MLTRAIVRSPAPSFANGLTSAGLGEPDYERALAQHQAYCEALEKCGLTLTTLPPDPAYPDSTFVEDAAVLTKRGAVLTRPGAASRLGEIENLRAVLAQLFPAVQEIEAPGTVDGGDVCEAGNHSFIGLSERTNEAGAQQLAEILSEFGYRADLVDIRNVRGLLHLKSAIAYLGNNHLVVTESMADRREFANYDLIRVNHGDEYAANCVRVNDHVLVAAGYSSFEAGLIELGYQTIALEMSEFQKMDGGLSCLSLRF